MKMDAVTLNVIRKLDQTMLRHQVAAKNIQLANTPNARAFRVQQNGDVVHSAQPVQLDDEVAEMLSATLNYQVLADAISRHMSLSRLAISSRT